MCLHQVCWPERCLIGTAGAALHHNGAGHRSSWCFSLVLIRQPVPFKPLVSCPLTHLQLDARRGHGRMGVALALAVLAAFGVEGVQAWAASRFKRPVINRLYARSGPLAAGVAIGPLATGIPLWRERFPSRRG